MVRAIPPAAGSVSQVLLVSALIVGIVALTIGFTDSLQHPETAILSESWESVAEQARRLTLPEEPTLIRDSPMQAWLKGRADIWGKGSHEIKQVFAGAVGGHALRVLTGFGPFLNHKAERYLAYGFPPGRLGHASKHENVYLRALSAALEHLWATPSTPGAFAVAWMMRHVGQGSLVTESIDSSAPQLAEFMPEGCLRDDRFADSIKSQAELLRASDCRSITASFHLGGKGGVETALNYDLSHNLILQVAGTKRVTLLPPSAHRRLHLYPYWHGSGQQAQQERSASHAAFEQDHVAEEHHTAAHHAHVAHAALWDFIEKHQKHDEHGDLHAHVGDHKEKLQEHADNYPNGTVVTLQQGDVLFVPSMFFVSEESLTSSASIRWGSGGLARDVWNFVVGPEIGAGEGRWPSAVCGLDLDHLPRPHTRAQRSAHEPLACVRAQLVVLLAEVGKLEDSKAPHGMGSLLQRANAMIETRYNTKTLPLYGSPYQEDPPPASAGNAEGVKMVERTCRGLHHEEMHAVDHRIHVREDPPVDEESQKRASVAARALMLLDPDRRELMLDELVDHAAAWAVAQALGADADGAAARMFVYACCSRM